MSSAENIYIGTSGWSYPKGEGTWNGYFYPAGRINELEFYSQFFNAVEINSSFYRPPDPGYVANWVKRVPADFRFAVKLWQKFTHPAMYHAATGEPAVISPEDVAVFNNSLGPMVKAGKLGALLAQFPPSFRNDNYGRQALAALANTFGQYPLAVELRHRSWSDDAATAALLRRCNIAWVQIDEPKFADSIAPEIPATADMAYFRFHGRNKKEWWTGDAATRYRYLYSREEISELSEKVSKAAAQAKLLFAFFNNHWKAYAPRNANDMKKALQLSFQDIPAPLEMLQDTGKEKQMGER
jgi:uncharacterized protein YecE (DUF72 family)